MFVWRIRGKIIITVLCCIVYHNCRPYSLICSGGSKVSIFGVGTGVATLSSWGTQLILLRWTAGYVMQFWQVAALSWTFLGPQGGQKFHWGAAPGPFLEPPLLICTLIRTVLTGELTIAITSGATFSRVGVQTIAGFLFRVFCVFSCLSLG